MTDLQGRVALVTGSSRGIGAAIARCFAAEGAAVALHGRDPQAVATVQEQIAAAGGTAMSVLADLTDLTQIEAMRASIEDELGPVEAPGRQRRRKPDPSRTGRGHHRRGMARLDRCQPHRHLPHSQGLPARDEGSSPGNDHHHVLGRRSPPDRRLADRLRRRQGRDRTADQGDRPPSRSLRHPGQLHRPRDHPDRTQPTADPPHCPGAAAPSPPHPTSRHPRGCRRLRTVPRLAALGLDQRRHPRRRRGRQSSPDPRRAGSRQLTSWRGTGPDPSAHRNNPLQVCRRSEPRVGEHRRERELHRAHERSAVAERAGQRRRRIGGPRST